MADESRNNNMKASPESPMYPESSPVYARASSQKTSGSGYYVSHGSSGMWRLSNEAQNSFGVSLFQPGSSSPPNIQSSRMASLPHHHAKIAAIVSRTHNVDNRSDKSDTEPIHSLFSDKTHWTALDLGGMAIRNISPTLFSFQFLTTLYLNHNLISTIPPEIGLLKNLQVLHFSSNRIKFLPPEIGKLANLRELLLFDNLLSTLPFEFGYLHRLKSLGLDGNPWTEPLFSLIQRDGPLSVISFLRDHSPTYSIPERAWITFSNKIDTMESFTVLTYNILSDTYAKPDLYGYTPNWALSWEYRKKLILKEILGRKSDVICLQELQSSEYPGFSEILRDIYDGHFIPKTRVRTMTEQEKPTVDGCAVFYRRSKFRVEKTIDLDFVSMAMNHPHLAKSDDLYNRVLIKDNVGILCLLTLRHSKKQILLGNVHLHWNPLYKDVKIIQTLLLMEKIDDEVRNRQDLGVVLVGDFNAGPDSGVYAFLSAGSLPSTHPDFNSCTYDPFTSTTTTHTLNLHDCYPSSEIITDYTDRFSGTIDYIWYGYSKAASENPPLALTGILEGLKPAILEPLPGLPSPQLPSDHVMLMAEFQTTRTHRILVNKPGA